MFLKYVSLLLITPCGSNSLAQHIMVDLYATKRKRNVQWNTEVKPFRGSLWTCWMLRDKWWYWVTELVSRLTQLHWQFLWAHKVGNEWNSLKLFPFWQSSRSAHRTRDEVHLRLVSLYLYTYILYLLYTSLWYLRSVSIQNMHKHLDYSIG